MEYREEQSFTQSLWIILLTLASIIPGFLVILWGIIQQLLLGEPFGDKPMSDVGLIVFSAFMLVILGGVLWLILACKLITQIDELGVTVRFIPFHRRPRHYPWDSLVSAEIRKYKPILEYGGWGLRAGLWSKNTAFNVKGNMGLQLVMKDGRRLLIGTQHPMDIEQALLQFRR